MPDPAFAPRFAVAADGEQLIEGGIAMAAFVLFALALLTEWRFRITVSASVPEAAAEIAIVAMLFARANAPSEAATHRLWLVFALLTTTLVLRAFYFRLHLRADVESAFSHIRDAEVPLFFVLLARTRLRFGERALARITVAFLIMGTVAGAIGISQFEFNWPYLYDGIDIVKYKTLYAQKYWLARVLHLDVQQLARGLHGFSISYATAMVLPSVTAFALALAPTVRRRWRVLAGIAFCVIYAGIYLSFSRSVVALVPVGCAVAGLAIFGKLRPSYCVALVLVYVGVAFIGPLLHLSQVDDSDLGTLNSRAATVMAWVAHVKRDPSILLLGSPVGFWREWNDLSPHNWVVNSLLSDGVPATVLRIGLWIALLAVFYPARKNQPAISLSSALAAGLFGGSFTLLCLVGETEPFNGITEYLVAAFGLGLLATIPPASPAQRRNSNRVSPTSLPIPAAAKRP